MSTYWVLTNKPPEEKVYLDAWELFLEKFGSEPFSARQAEKVLEENYPSLGWDFNRRMLSALVSQGNLGISEREF